MSLLGPSSQNPLGLHPGRVERVRVKVRGGAVVLGNLVEFDLIGNAGEVVDSINFGGATDNYSNVQILATAGGIANASRTLYGVMQEAVADDGEGWCVVRGVVKALGGATMTIGLPIGDDATTAGEFGVPGVNDVIMGYTMEAAANATLSTVLFNGIEGFGIRGV